MNMARWVTGYIQVGDIWMWREGNKVVFIEIGGYKSIHPHDDRQRPYKIEAERFFTDETLPWRPEGFSVDWHIPCDLSYGVFHDGRLQPLTPRRIPTIP